MGYFFYSGQVMNIQCSVLVIFSVYCCISASMASPDENPIKRAGMQAPMRFGKRSVADPGMEDDLLRMTRTPMRFGKRSFWSSDSFTKKSPMRSGKRSPLRFGKRAPMRFGKRDFDPAEHKRAPMRFGKRTFADDDWAVYNEKRAPMRFGKRGSNPADDLLSKRAPMRFGKRIIEEEEGMVDKRAPMRFGKRGDWTLEDLFLDGDGLEAPLPLSVGRDLDEEKRAPMRFGKRFSDSDYED